MAKQRVIPLVLTADPRSANSTFGKTFDFIKARAGGIATQLQKSFVGNFNLIEARARTFHKNVGDDSARFGQRTAFIYKTTYGMMDKEAARATSAVQQIMRSHNITTLAQLNQFLNQQTNAFTAAARSQTRTQEQATRADLSTIKKAGIDKTKVAETTARSSAASYSKHLGTGFFNRLGREATNAFKRSLNIDVTDGGGGGILSGALSVAGGNAITNILGKITGAITGTVKAGFDFNRLQEQTAIGFRVIMKDGEKALSFMRELQAFEKESPMDLPGVYTGAQRLMAMGFQAKEIIPILRAAGDAAAGLGKVGGDATAKVDSITLALGQMWQKGKVSAEEMSQQLVEQGIPAWRYLADEIARTDTKFAKLSDEDRTARVMKMAERNMLNARTAVATIVKGMARDFEGLGKEIAEQTASGLETNISSSFSRQMGTATAPAFGQYKKVLSTTLGVLNSEVADKFVGGVSAGTGALFNVMDATLKAVTTGDISGLGIGAVQTFTEGVKSVLPQAATAGASIIQTAVAGGEKAHGDASARWSELGKDASKKFYEGFAHGGGLQQDGTIERLLADPRIKALLEVIKTAEGGDERTLYGGKQWSGSLDQFPQWSGKKFYDNKSNRWRMTHAAGSYQFQPGTYAGIGREFGLPSDFNQRAQDLHAVALLKKIGAIDALNTKGFAATIPLLGSQWASIPGNLPGNKFNPHTLEKMYAQNLAAGAGSSWLSAGAFTKSNPMPVAVVREGDVWGGANELGYQIPTPGDLDKVGGFGDSFNFSGMDISQRQAAQVLEIFEQARSKIIETSDSLNMLSTEVVTRGLKAIPLPALAAQQAFENLPPLIKKSADASQAYLDDVRKGIGSIAGDGLESLLTEGASNASEAVQKQFKSLLLNLAKEWVESSIFKMLGGGKGKGESGSGSILSSLFGGIKRLFGGGGKSGAATTPGFAGGSPAGIAAASANQFAAPSAIAMTGGAGSAAASAGVSGGAGAGGAAAGGGLSLAKMGAFLTNPWTIGIAAAAVGGLLLWRHFRNGTEKKLQKAIRSMYGVEIKDMAILSQIKQVGESVYGRGKVGQNIAGVLKLDSVKEIINGYADSTGQEARGLTTNAQYGDPTSSVNQFTNRPGSAIGSIGERLRASASSSSQGASASSATGSSSPAQGISPIAILTRVVQSLEAKITSMRPGEVVAIGAPEASEEIGKANNTALRNGSVRQGAQEALGMRS